MIARRGRRASATRAGPGWTWPPSACPPDGLIATTDADSEPAPDWLRAQLDAVARGRAGDRRARSRSARTTCPAAALARRDADARTPAGDAAQAPARASTTSSAARRSAVTAATYAQRRPPRAARGARGRGLRARAAPPRRPDRAARRRARHHVGAPARARAGAGWPSTCAATRWLAERSYDAGDFPLDRLLAAKDRTISVILPARERRGHARRRPRRDRRPAPARRRGARRRRRLARRDRRGRPRARRDGDREQISTRPCSARATRCGAASQHTTRRARRVPRHRHRGLHRRVRARPARPAADRAASTSSRATSGARCASATRPTPTAAAASPSCSPARTSTCTSPSSRASASRSRARWPRRATLLERLPFPVGYGVEIAMLIDAARAVGLERMAQVDLGTRQNRHQPLARPLADGARGARRGRAAHPRRAHARAAAPPDARPTSRSAPHSPTSARRGQPPADPGEVVPPAPVRPREEQGISPC